MKNELGRKLKSGLLEIERFLILVASNRSCGRVTRWLRSKFNSDRSGRFWNVLSAKPDMSQPSRCRMRRDVLFKLMISSGWSASLGLSHRRSSLRNVWSFKETPSELIVFPVITTDSRYRFDVNSVRLSEVQWLDDSIWSSTFCGAAVLALLNGMSLHLKPISKTVIVTHFIQHQPINSINFRYVSIFAMRLSHDPSNRLTIVQTNKWNNISQCVNCSIITWPQNPYTSG